MATIGIYVIIAIQAFYKIERQNPTDDNTNLLRGSLATNEQHFVDFSKWS